MKNDGLQKKIEESACKMGYNIMHVRVNKGIDLPAVSAALGISIYALKNIEEGKNLNVKVSLLFRLVKYYEVEIKDLFEDM